VFFVDTIEVPGLGNRSYLAGGPRGAVAVDPPRDVDRVIAAAALRGVRIRYVVETHLHNDYVTGGLELARLTGAAYLVPAAARVAFQRIPVADGDSVEVDAGLTLRALATPLSALSAGAALPPAAQHRPLVAVCRSGKRSLEAAALLAARGFEVVDVIGGMQAWARAGLPTVAASGRGTRTSTVRR